MFCCIECGAPVNQLYREYGPGNIRLAQCESCLEFVDKYVEFDLILIFIDLVLLKKQAYRHMIFNRIPFNDCGLNDGIIRLAVLLNLFEVYMKWFQIEQSQLAMKSTSMSISAQYLYILAICFWEFGLFHLMIRYTAGFMMGRSLTLKEANHVSMSLIMSSFGKILLIVMVIWDYGDLNPSLFINFFVLICNWAAISVALNLSIKKTGLILFYGLAFKFTANLMIGLYDAMTVVII